MLVWNPTDVLSCLEVLPEVEDQEVSHNYAVTRDGMQLCLTVRQHSGDICIILLRDGVEPPIVQMHMIGCTGCRLVSDKRGEYLEFAPAKCFGSRYDGNAPIPYGVRIAAKPHIAITLF